MGKRPATACTHSIPVVARCKLLIPFRFLSQLLWAHISTIQTRWDLAVVPALRISPNQHPRISEEHGGSTAEHRATKEGLESPYCFASRLRLFVACVWATALTCASRFEYGTLSRASSRNPLIPRVFCSPHTLSSSEVETT